MATSHSKKAAAFLSNPDKVTRHDQTFWGIREKRDIQAAMLPEWEDLREHASQIKEHTLTHLQTTWRSLQRTWKAMALLFIGQKMRKNLTK